MLRLHINPVLGAKPLRDIRKVHIKDWWASMPVTPLRKNAYRLIGMVLSSAVDDDELEVNPAYRAIKKAGTDLSKPRPYLSPEMFAKVHAACSLDMAAFVMLVLGGSLRIGEALGLDRRDLDLQTGVLTINNNAIARDRNNKNVPTARGGKCYASTIKAVVESETAMSIA